MGKLDGSLRGSHACPVRWVSNGAEVAKPGGQPDFARFQGIGIALGYSYESSAIVPDGTAAPHVADSVVEYVPSARPGSRAPHVWLEYDGKRMSTLDLFEKRFVLLSGPDGQGWCRAAAGIAAWTGVPLDAYRIGACDDLRDPDGTWCRTYGVTWRGTVLVRPDGHVAWRSETGIGDASLVLQQALARVLDRRLSRPPAWALRLGLRSG